MKRGGRGDSGREVIEESMEEIDDEILQDLYTWVDHVPLSRPKRNMARDFSDAVLCAEVMAHHFPKMVDLHNYVPASSARLKEDNWKLLNRKVLRKLNMELSDDVIKSLAMARPFTIERVLLILRSKIDRTIFEKQRNQDSTRQQLSDRPEVDQHHTGSRKDPSPGRAKPGKPAHIPPVLETGKQSQITSKISAREAKEYTSDYMSRLAYEEKAQECLAKDETIEILNAKVRRLEHLVHLKDIRIEDLQNRLEELRPTNKRH